MQEEEHYWLLQLSMAVAVWHIRVFIISCCDDANIAFQDLAPTSAAQSRAVLVYANVGNCFVNGSYMMETPK